MKHAHAGDLSPRPLDKRTHRALQQEQRLRVTGDGAEQRQRRRLDVVVDPRGIDLELCGIGHAGHGGELAELELERDRRDRPVVRPQVRGLTGRPDLDRRIRGVRRQQVANAGTTGGVRSVPGRT